MSHLYVVATPIGNLEDVTLRALRILGEVSLVAAEDTRTAAVFLRHHGLNPRLLSYTDHNKDRRIPLILQRLDEADVALITDAGTPAISDPGVHLVDAARRAGHTIVTVPGAAAPIAALSVSGLGGTAFRFAGFFPRPAGELRRLLTEASQREETLIAFEAPTRLRRALEAIDAVLPGRRIAVCRELTKLHEETFVGTAAEALAHFDATRGEIVVIIEGAGKQDAAAGDDDEAALREEIAAMREAGLTRSQATTLLSRRYQTPRRRLYELWLAPGQTD